MLPSFNNIYYVNKLMTIETEEFVALSDVMSAKKMREMEGEISRLECELEQWKEAAESCRVKVGILSKQPHMLPSEECLVLSCEKLRDNLRQIKDLAFSSSVSALLQCCLPHGASPEDCHRVAKLMPMYTIEDRYCEEASETNLPSELTTEEACLIRDSLVEAGLIDENWQTKNLSGSESAMMAQMISDRLDIKETWRVFGRLWNKKPETLRAFYNRSLDQKKSLTFQDRLKGII